MGNIDSRPQSCGFTVPQVPRSSWPTDRTYLLDTNSTPINLAKEYVADIQPTLPEDVHFQYKSIQATNPFVKNGLIVDNHPFICIQKSNVNHAKTIQFVIEQLKGTKFYTESKTKEDELVKELFPFVTNQTDGIFAKTFIPGGTYIARGDECIPSLPNSGFMENNKAYDNIINKTNDLNFYYFQQEHEYTDLETIKQHTNVKIVSVEGVKYLVAIRDIQPGEELSRYYGPSYWFTKDQNDVCIEVWENIIEYKSQKTMKQLINPKSVEKMTSEELQTKLEQYKNSNPTVVVKKHSCEIPHTELRHENLAEFIIETQ